MNNSKKNNLNLFNLLRDSTIYTGCKGTCQVRCCKYQLGLLCMFQCLLSLHVLPDRFDDDELRDVWGPYHLLQDFLYFLPLMIVLCHSDTVMLQNEFGMDQMHLCLYCMMEMNLNLYQSVVYVCSQHHPLCTHMGRIWNKIQKH